MALDQGPQRSPRLAEHSRPGLQLSATPADESALPSWLSPSFPAMLEPPPVQLVAAPRANLYRVRGGVLGVEDSPKVTGIRRRGVSIGLSTTGRDFEIFVRGKWAHYNAVLVTPMTLHSFRAHDVGVVVVVINADQEAYRFFSHLRQGMVLRLPLAAFEPWADEMNASLEARFSIEQACALFDSLVRRMTEFFPSPPPLDERVAVAMRMVKENPRISLDEVARSVALSPSRLSHLFTKYIGLPLRSYQLWQKTYFASLLLENNCKVIDAAQQAGFTDMEHLCRVFRAAYGRSPSIVYDGRRFVSHMGDASRAESPDSGAGTAPSAPGSSG
jgi:AraC-like DNA-binding protein